MTTHKVECYSNVQTNLRSMGAYNLVGRKTDWMACHKIECYNNAQVQNVVGAPCNDLAQETTHDPKMSFNKIAVLADKTAALADKIAALADKIAALADKFAVLADKIEVPDDKCAMFGGKLVAGS